MNILICIPTYNEYIHSKLVTDLLNLDLGRRYVIKFTVRFKCGSLIPRIRNNFISEFIADDSFTHLLFIDSDIYGFTETLEKMILSQKDLIGGVYRKKMKFEEYNINLLNNIDQTLCDEFPEVKHIPTGLMLISRNVTDLLSWKYPERVYFEGQKKRYDFFKCGIENGLYLSEDYGFCELYRNVGGKVHCVLDSEITHHGIMNYKGNFKKYLINI